MFCEKPLDINATSGIKRSEMCYFTVCLITFPCCCLKELKLLLHRSTLLKTQGQKQDYLDAMIAMISMLLKVAPRNGCINKETFLCRAETIFQMV